MDCILLHLSYDNVCQVDSELFCWISADTRFHQLAALIISAFFTLELRLHQYNPNIDPATKDFDCSAAGYYTPIRASCLFAHFRSIHFYFYFFYLHKFVKV